MFGTLTELPPGRAHDQDTALGGFVEIDIVDATPARPTTAVFWLGRAIRGDFGRAAHDQGIRIGELRVERVLGGLHDVPRAALGAVCTPRSLIFPLRLLHEPVVSSRFSRKVK